jgi:hypothetical protein
MLSTAAGVPTAPVGAGGDFLAALTAALGATSVAAPIATVTVPDVATSAPTTPTAPAAVIAPTAAVVEPVQPDNAVVNAVADLMVGTSSPSVQTVAATSVITSPSPSPTSTATSDSLTGDPSLAATSPGAPRTPTTPTAAEPAVHPAQRLAPASRPKSPAAWKSTSESADVADVAGLDRKELSQPADPATPQRPAERCVRVEIPTGAAAQFVPPTAAPVAAAGVLQVPASVSATQVGTTASVQASGAAAVAAMSVSVDQASPVDGSTPVSAAPPSKSSAHHFGSDEPASTAVTVPVEAASALPITALGATSPTRGGQKARASLSSDSDAAPGSATTVDRPLPGHRLDSASSSATTATSGAPVATDAAPAGLGMMGADRVAKVREQVAGRPMQRLSIELDDARVAIRVRGDKVSVDVTSDPKGALGEGWARQVERTIDRAVRTQESDSRGSEPDRQPGSSGRGQQQSHRHGQRRGQQFEIGAWNFKPNFGPNLEGES